MCEGNTIVLLRNMDPLAGNISENGQHTNQVTFEIEIFSVSYLSIVFVQNSLLLLHVKI